MKNIDYESLTQETIKLIQSFVQVNTIRDEAKPQWNMPFGPGIDAGFDFILSFAKQHGLKTFKDPNGYYAYIEVGPQNYEQMIGIIGHIDTVAIGDINNWDLAKPFSGDIVDNKIIGRGSLDDKGPVCVNLMALITLVKNGYEFKHPIRLILGGAEETTWECINAYKAHEIIPKISYSPDAEFPVINKEQGILQLKITTNHQYDYQITTNNSVNMVCDYVKYQANNINDINHLIKDSYIEDNCLIITGTPAHAMEAYKGDSAILKLVNTLEEDHSLISFIKNHLTNPHGEKLFTFNDQSMSLNIGNLNINKQEASLDLDLRLPINCDLEMVKSQLIALANQYDLNITLIKYQPQLYIADNDPLVTTLLDTYNSVLNTNEQPLSTGGGTYARAFPNCVAFGMVFSSLNMSDKMHQPNECLEIKFIKPALEIYLKAILALDNLNL